MSVFRIGLSGKGIGNAVQTRPDGEFTRIIAGDSDITAWRVRINEDIICFEVGHSFGYSEEFDDFLYNLTTCLPDTTINYYWHSTMSNMSGSYNIGFIDGEYTEWDDDEVYPYFGIKIIHEGIGKLLQCGDKDAAGFTHVLVNGKEFWLNGLYVDDNCIWFNNAEKGSRRYTGIEEELIKALPDHEMTIEDDDFYTGEVGEYKATLVDGKYDKQFLGWKEI